MRKLPVGKAVENCLRSVVAYSPEAAKIGLPWIVVVFILAIIQAFLVPDDFLDPKSIVSSVSQGNYRPLLIMYFDITVYLLALSSIAVNWHKFALLEEMPSGLAWLRIDSLTLRYFGNLVLILLIIIILASIVGFGTIMVSASDLISPGVSDIIDLISIILITLAMLLIFSILSLKLPPIAINAPKIGFLDTLKFAKGNYMSIFGYALALAVCVTIVRIIAKLIDSYIFSYGDIVGGIMSVIMHLAIMWFSLMVGIASITTLYGYFVEKRDFDDASDA
jgi:hypothetical protein